MQSLVDELSYRLEISHQVIGPISNSIETCVQRAFHASRNDDMDHSTSDQAFDQTKLQELMDHSEEMSPVNGKETPTDTEDITL